MTKEENILLVYELEPKLKHPTIFDRFDILNDKESLTIHNDHDPKPLYYQMLGERGNIFIWEYLEEGPELWRVRLTKKLTGEADETLGEIVAKDMKKAQIFKKFGLDFCCGGKKTVKEACAEKGLDVTVIEQALQQADKVAPMQTMAYNEWNLDFLADFIVNTHHSYVKKTTPDLRMYADKVAKVHGGSHPELERINQLTQAVCDELETHLIKEENVLFPFIKEMVKAKSNGMGLTNAGLDSVQAPIKMMEIEHETAGNWLEEIKELSNNYTLPSDACASYTVLYKTLEEFTDDLHTHIHLENNILFPKALQLEKELRTI